MNQLSFDDPYEGMSQNTGQGETSGEAAEWITSKAGKLRRTVLWAIRNAPDGLTDEEGQDVLGMEGNTYRPRRVELHKGWRDIPGGFVEDRGVRRKGRSGRSAIVWYPTPRGFRV